MSAARNPAPRRTFKPLPALIAAAASTLIVGCGGGGGSDAPGPVGPASPAATAAESLATSRQFTLAAAPALPEATPPAPGVAWRCGNVSLGTARTGEIQVPPGEVCVLQGTRVEGNIQLGAGSVLDARDVTVIGNLQGDRAASVLLAGASSLGGSLQLKGGGSATVIAARIAGDLQWDDQRGPLLAVGNQVGGNVQVVGNRGGVTLQDNRAGGNLQCKENDPAPRGSRNVAAAIEDQCVGMAPADSGAQETPANPPAAPLPPGDLGSLPATRFASGSNVNCLNLRLGADTYANVTVPAGARCELVGTRLTGTLELQAGAAADGRDVRIEGNLQADGAEALTWQGGRISGSVQLDRGRTATLDGTVIVGAVQLVANSGLLWLQGLQIGADLQVFQNRGGVTLNGNVANGNLQCKENLPAPGGSGNRAASLEDQCAAL
jgi:hypothetical protein